MKYKYQDVVRARVVLTSWLRKLRSAFQLHHFSTITSASLLLLRKQKLARHGGEAVYELPGTSVMIGSGFVDSSFLYMSIFKGNTADQKRKNCNKASQLYDLKVDVSLSHLNKVTTVNEWRGHAVIYCGLKKVPFLISPLQCWACEQGGGSRCPLQS